MWTPAAASVVARLALHDGLGDVSFRLGGRRGSKAIGLALIFPVVIGLIAYGIAWTTGRVQFSPRPNRLTARYIANTTSLGVVFLINLAVAATVGTANCAVTAAGEEIGWRGFKLTRLLDAWVAQPTLTRGRRWGLS